MTGFNLILKAIWLKGYINIMQFLVYGMATGTATWIGCNTARVDKISGVLGNRIRSSASWQATSTRCCQCWKYRCLIFIQRKRWQVTVKLCVLVHWLVTLFAANDTYNVLPTIINIVDIKRITKQQHFIHV